MTLCIDQDLEDSEEIVENSNPDAEREFLERMAAGYIEDYFRDKVVPECFDILSPRYISMCIEMNICKAVDMAYEAIARFGLVTPDSEDSAIEPDIRMVIGILRRMKPLVPQEFSAGMLLMHFEIMEGVTF